MHKNCFINFAFIFLSLKVILFYVTMKKKLSGKVTQVFLSLKLYWNLKYNMKQCLHTFICLLIAYLFIGVMCFIPKNSFMFNVSKTDVHICFIEYVLSILCVKCIICDVT